MMGKVSRDEVLELIQPTMYWVAQNEGELHRTSKGDYEGFINKTGRDLRYREVMVEAFGEDSVREVREHGSLTMVELADRCDAWSCGIYQQIEGEESAGDELEDVAFWSGEVAKGIEVVRKLLVHLGWEDNDEIEELINYAGYDHVGTKVE